MSWCLNFFWLSLPPLTSDTELRSTTLKKDCTFFFCGPPLGAQGELHEAAPSMPIPFGGTAWEEQPREARLGPPLGDQNKRRQTHKQTNPYINKQANKQTKKEANKETNKERSRETNGRPSKQSNTQGSKQTKKQTPNHKESEKQRSTQTNRRTHKQRSRPPNR